MTETTRTAVEHGPPTAPGAGGADARSALARPVSVALVVGSLRCGGSERTVAGLSRELVRRGHRATVMTLDREENDFFELAPGVERTVLGGWGPSRTPWRRWTASRARVRRLRTALERSGCELVVGFTQRTCVLVAQAARGTGLAIVSSERTDPRHHPLPPLWRWLVQRAYRASDVVVANGGAAVTWWAARIGGERIRRIPNFVERPDDARPAAVGVGGPLLLSVGRLIRSKGVGDLLEAFARARHRAGWTLALAGDGPLRGELERECDRRGLGASVRFLGPVADPWPWLLAADAFAFPSRYEGMPNAVLEALAAGLPVVAYDSGAGELVEDGVSGRLVPGGDVGALARALDEVLGDAALRTAWSAEALAASRRYSPERVTREWEQAFADALARRQRR